MQTSRSLLVWHGDDLQEACGIFIHDHSNLIKLEAIPGSKQYDQLPQAKARWNEDSEELLGDRSAQPSPTVSEAQSPCE